MRKPARFNAFMQVIEYNCTAHSAQRTAHSAQRTAHSAQRTAHSAQRTAHSAQRVIARQRGYKLFAQNTRFLSANGASQFQPGATPQVSSKKAEQGLKARRISTGSQHCIHHVFASPLQGLNRMVNVRPGALPQAGIATRRWRFRTQALQRNLKPQ